MNKIKINYKNPLLLGVIASTLILNACGSSSNNSAIEKVDKTYKVTLNNVTANQPLSPAMVVLHKPSLHLFEAGKPASVGLEKLAEGGSNLELIDEAKADDAFLASKSGAGAIPPGAAGTVELSISEDEDSVYISVAAMLVNTNDAFAGGSSSKISKLQKGESFSMHVPIWDAGTEANSEAAGTLPGPADGGEGFNASREGDADFVAIHQGIVSNADGFASSVLGESHRFDNPGALLRVERID